MTKRERSRKIPTAKKQRHASLGYERYKAVVENATDFIFTIDAEDKVLSANLSAARVFGIEPEEIRGKSIFDLFPKEIASQYSRNMKKVFRSGKNAVFEDKMPVGGKEFWLSTSLTPVKDASGRISAVLGVSRNITGRKTAEDELKESEKRYRSLFDRMLDGVYLSTHEGRFVDVNSAFVKMFGYSSKQEMLAITDIKKQLYFSPEERGSHILDTGQDEVDIYRMRRKDGSEIWVEDHGRYVHDNRGHVTYHEGILRDITERKHAEEALRESELKYRALVEDSPNLIGILQDGVLKYVNTATIGKLGWSHDELISPLFNPIETTVAERFRGVIKENVTRRLRGENVSPYEASLTTKTGQEIPFLLHAASILYEGRPAIEFSFADITERKRLEEELRKLTQFLESIIQNANVWLNVIDKQENVLMWNKAAEQISGYSREEVTGNGKVWQWLYPDETYRKQIMDLVPDTKQEIETTIKRKDGATRVILWNERALVDGNGKTTGSIVIGRDVTEQKRMQDEVKRYSEHLEELVAERSGRLAESEEQYRRLFESAPVSLWEEDFSEVKKYLDGLRSSGVVDLNGYFMEHPDDLAKCASMVMVVNVNETTLKMYGAKTVEELRGELRRVFSLEFHDRFREELVALGEGKKQFASEFDNQTLAGDIRHVSLIINVIPGYEDSLTRVLVSIIDLTDRKQMEQRLQQAERLAAVGETAAMVGHDLRNPLQGIAGAIHLLKEDALTTSERDELIQLIQNSIDYSNAIVRDLTEYSAEIQLNLAETTPKSIIGEAIQAVNIPAHIAVEDSSKAIPVIKVDQDRMRRVFINLIENAIDAMPQQGTLTISSEQSNGKVEFTFSDTGSGIPQRMMANLWKPLQTTKAKGMGLGLAICRRLVEAHGGTISVRNSGDEGTTIRVQLPTRHLEVKNN